MRKKKSIYMFKVVCWDCGRIRLWDDENDFLAETCPECSSKDLTVKEVEVKE